MEKKHNIDKLQGYPHYPSKEDIMLANNNNGKVPIGENKVPEPPYNDTVDERDKDVSIVKGTEADITPEDLRMLESTDQNMDTPDARNLVYSSLDNTDLDGDPLNADNSLMDDVAGTDLDIPGASADDRDELIGEEDEENNLYSLGGDNHESQEENKGE
jgi:hypothetical protein